MELYVYDSPDGAIADFRPYLDGQDNSFEEPLPLKPTDARWEKIKAIFHPETGRLLAGKLQFVGRTEIHWKELMRFPLAWDREYEPIAES